MATLRETFKDIADAIRDKGVSGTFKPTEMADKIGEIQTGGWLPPPDIPDDVTGMDLTLYSCEDNNAYQFRAYNPNYSTTKPTVPASWDGGDALTNVKKLNAGEQIKIVRSNDADTCRFGVSTSNAVILTPTGKTYVYGELSKQHIALNPPNYCYSNYFYGNSHIDIPRRGGLLCRAMSQYCYYNMFYNCSSLTQAPELPATTLAEYCYYNMFYNCSSLTQAPELPATTLANDCYWSMFYNCSSLTQAPELPATTLADRCYQTMFNGCISLTQAPELPATTLAYQCYYGMFYNCSSLTQAPELPATTLANQCYWSMFQNCTSLKRIKMNASSGGWGSSMFSGCTSLELVDMTGSTGVPTLSNVNNFRNTNDIYKIVVPDSLYDDWIVATNWSDASIKPHIMKQSDWNSAHPDDILGQ